MIAAGTKRGVVRIEQKTLTAPAVEQLSDSEFRAIVLFWSWTARYGKDGEVPREWVRTFSYGRTPAGRARKISERMLERFVELGLLEQHIYGDTGQRVIQVAHWRDYRPIDPTSDERKRRFRRRLYGDSYYGVESDLADVLPVGEGIGASE